MDIHSLRVTGSLEVTGSLFVNGTNISSGGSSFPYTGSAIISGSLILIGSSSFSGSITSGIPADNADYAPNVFTPFSRVTPITYTNYGVASLTTMVATGSYDDFSYGILLPFTMSFFDRPYTQVFVGSNSYLTFGVGSTSYSGLAPNSPAIPGIHVGAADNSLSRLLTGSEAGNTFRIKFEGFDRTTLGTLWYSWVFTSGSNTIQLHVDNIVPRAGAVTGVTTGSVNSTTYANVDYFYFPPLTTTSSVAYSITTSSGSYSPPVVRPSFANAEGFQTVAFGLGSHAEGYKTTAKGDYAHSEGSASFASGSFTHTEGVSTNARGFGSHAEGSGSISSGSFSHAEGILNVARGEGSHAEGNYTLSSGGISHAEGSFTVSSGNGSHAEGSSTTSTGQSSHAEGTSTNSIGSYSHAEGIGTITTAGFSHAEGSATRTDGQASHSEGYYTTASAEFSHAEGSYNIARGPYSHAEGSGSISFGTGSHAEGISTVAFGTGSHAEGSGSIASGSHQHVSGRFNQHGNLTSLVVVGNGTSNASRSDIFRINPTDVQITGSLALSGSFTVSSGSITMPDRPAFRVTGAGGAKVATTVLSGSYLNVDYQQGSGWDNTTGTFTAPITGLYQVNVVTRINSNTLGTISQLIVYKNYTGLATGTAQIMIEFGVSSSMNHTGGSTISKLTAGDTLKMVVAVGEISFDQNDNFSVAYIG